MSTITEHKESKKKTLIRSKIYQQISSKNVVSRFMFHNSTKRFTKRNKTKIDNKNRLNKEEMEIEIKRMKKMLRHSTAYDLCISALLHKPSDRTIELNKTITYYLKNMKNFMNIFSNEEEEDLEKVLADISSHLKYDTFLKNNVICKYGDNADKFYIILKGKVIFLVPKMHKHYLSEEEYIEYLIKLRKKGENEIVKNLIITNQLIFYFGDNFDDYVINCLQRHEKNNEKLYSERIYNLLYEFKNFIKKEKEEEKNNKNNFNENAKESIDIKELIKTTALYTYDDPEYTKIKKKKLITTFEYESTNIFEEGDTFGSVGTNNSNNKRTATSVCFEDCHLGILEKDDYLNILEKVNSKAKDRLFDLVTENRIFIKLSKFIFINKYIFMFHFVKYYKHDFILNDNQKFDNLIILYKGEYTLSINKNILELNDLIVKFKKIRGNLMNLPEEIVKKDLKEINENKSLLIKIKYSSKNVANLIMKKQNYIISKVKENLVIGYPNTIDPETNLPLFNCQCASNHALGYKVKKEMLNLIEKDGYLRKKPTEMAINLTDLFLERLLELKNMIMNRINNPGNYIYEENNKIEEVKNNNSENGIKENMEDNKIERNYIPKNNKTSSILFDFNKKILDSSSIDKSLIRNKTKTFSPITRRLQTINVPEINKEPSIKNFFSMILKFKKNAFQKMKLLNKVQKQSRRFLIKEKIELKQIQMNLNKLKTKDEFNDLSTLFAKNPKPIKTLLDRLKEKKIEDNVLDPIISDIKKKMKNINILSQTLRDEKNKNETINKSYESFNKLFNTFINNTNLNINDKIDSNSQTDTKYIKTMTEKNNYKLNNKKFKNKFSKSYNHKKFKDFKSVYNNTDLNNRPSPYNLTKINLNEIDISKTNNYYYNNTIHLNDNSQDLYNMLYLKYIMDELKVKNSKNLTVLSSDRYRTLNKDSTFMNMIFNQKKEELIIPNIVDHKNNKLLKK